MGSEFTPIQDRAQAARLIMLFLIILIGCTMMGALINTLYTSTLGRNTAGVQDVTQLQISLVILHSFSFLVPSLLFSWLYFRRKMSWFLQLHTLPPMVWIIISAFMLFALTPAIQYTLQLNQEIPLPSWMGNMEDQANQTLTKLLRMETLPHLLANLFVVAVLPALGEELLFRGILQQLGYRIFRKTPAISVWVTAFLFSAIHLQFEGFIPRFLLGAFLGYLFYWTRNLWIPICTHFVNNALMVFVAYQYPEEIERLNQSSMPDLPWYVALLSLLLALPGLYYFQTLEKSKRQGSDSA